MTAPNRPYETRTFPYGTAAIAEAARLIAMGEPVAVSTETVYGLAADATDSAAVARIYAAKGRPSFNPLIVHVPDLAAAERIAVFDESSRALAKAFWPGPLTLVLPLRPDAGIAALVTAGLDTIALRVPAHRAMRALLAATGKPLAAPSANASNRISPTRAEHVLASLDGRIALVVDDGPTKAGVESTIVKDGAILRPGPITASELRAVLPDGSRADSALPASETAQVTAPGQLASHYAPIKTVRLNARQAEPDEWLIGFGAIAGDDTLSSSGNLVEAAARLFDALHQADSSPKARIAVAPVPRSGVGVAINDRLARAAHRG
ncbi:L-threonylcarbamoyladenylate synthase [Hephaestia mangrovi]|uniref:L-threonylcarbamoyladenylate synthase n=1 Tax=Hephaestia mangrovi TaxID=2873268 RepID=UPI001CA64661|nr:L-threonylcarbamoyladenylate synthase [Hephaestia mangrovi]MBY8826756.1 threonylcarbamoyl-AMP synthase [Hephaestia mangrovi]